MHGWVFFHRQGKLRQQPAHRLKRCVLIGIERARDPTGVLLRKESLGNDDIHPHRQRHRGKVDQERGPWMSHDDAEQAAIHLGDSIEAAVNSTVEEQTSGRCPRLEQPGTHHRRCCQRYHHRHADRYRERDGKLAKQPADDPTHQ